MSMISGHPLWLGKIVCRMGFRVHRGDASTCSSMTVQGFSSVENGNAKQTSKTRLIIWSTLGAVIGAALLGLLGSGLMDAITGSGTPTPGGAIGSMVGAFGGGYFTMRLLRQEVS